MAAVAVFVDLARAPDGSNRTRYVVHPSSRDALALGRSAGSAWGATVYAAVVLHDPSVGGDVNSTGKVGVATSLVGLGELRKELGRLGADRVVVAVTDAPLAPAWSSVGVAWSGVLDHLRPRLVLFGADAPSTRDLAARTGARIGARLLARATAIGGDDLELRDRDGLRVRVGESGATVATVASAGPARAFDVDLVPELIVLALPGQEGHVELAGTHAAELTHGSVLVILGDDALEAATAAHARRLAELLGGTVVGGPAAGKVGVTALEPRTAIAPELAIVIGQLGFDIAGATSVVRLGVEGSGKGIDAILPPPVGHDLDELVAALERT